MKIKVYEDKSGVSKNIEIKDMEDLVDKLGIDINNFIIVRNGELVDSNAKINENDEIKFLSVISGG